MRSAVDLNGWRWVHPGHRQRCSLLLRLYDCEGRREVVLRVMDEGGEGVWWVVDGVGR